MKAPIMFYNMGNDFYSVNILLVCISVPPSEVIVSDIAAILSKATFSLGQDLPDMNSVISLYG